MSLDLQAITALVWRRLAEDPEGGAVRAALGNGAQSIIPVADLDRRPFPARPFLAFRRDAMPRIDRVVQVPTYTWLFYDDRDQGGWRLEALPGLIMTAYDRRMLNQARGGVIGYVQVGDAGPRLPDTSLGLDVSSIRVYIYAG